jgi:hypothetical protein
VSTKITLPSNAWTHLTVTWSDNKVRVYLNGALKKTFSSGPATGSGAFVVGGNGGGRFSGSFAGKLDEAALYSVALDAADIEGHFDAANVPVNTAPPTISGTPEVGQTLTAEPGMWVNGGTATYQWQRCDADGEDCEDIVGATAATYVVGPGEACGTIQVAVTMTNASGAATAFSEHTDTVAGLCGTTVPVNTTPPAIDDLEPVVGDTLIVTPGEWSDLGTPTYQWQRCDDLGQNCHDVDGANATTYVVGPDHACATLRVVETMTNVTGAGVGVGGDRTRRLPPGQHRTADDRRSRTLGRRHFGCAAGRVG